MKQLGVLLVVALTTGLLGASPRVGTAPAQEAPPHLDLLADRPASTMSMKLERTFLKVDAVNVALRVDSLAADSLATVLSIESEYERELEDRVARIILGTHEAVTEIEFLRGASLGQFLGGVDDNLERARDAGWIEEATYDDIRIGMRSWFAFLDDRRIQDGDHLRYRVYGDTLRSVFVAVTGEILLDQTDVGRQNVLAMLASYVAPGSDFRRGLIRSLWAATP